MADLREPVEPRHVAFAQAAVALARQHGIRSLKAEFYGGAPGQPWTRVSMAWCRGRDGESNRITLTAEATHHAPEVAPEMEAAPSGFSTVDRDGCLCVGSGPISPEIYSSNDLSAVIYDLIHIIDYMSISDGHQPSQAERKIKEARAIIARIDGGIARG